MVQFLHYVSGESKRSCQNPSALSLISSEDDGGFDSKSVIKKEQVDDQKMCENTRPSIARAVRGLWEDSGFKPIDNSQLASREIQLSVLEDLTALQRVVCSNIMMGGRF